MNSSFSLLRAHIRFKSVIALQRDFCQVLFFGSDAFSLFSLSKLHANLRSNIQVLDVVTTIGVKPNTVQEYCLKHGITVYPWPPDFQIASRPYDLGVVVSFGHLIPKKVIHHFPMGMINVHASLLPRWRGASPIIHSIMNGDTETGVTIMRINPHHFDTGDILLQNRCAIGENELMPTVYERLGKMGANCLLETLQSLPNSLERGVPQSTATVTYAPRIKSEIAHVRWAEKTAKDVYNLYRALFSVYELRSSWHGTAVKLKKLNVCDKHFPANPGQVHWLRSSKQLLVKCREGAVEIELLSIGGKSVRGVDFYNGYLSKRPLAEWTFS